MCGRKSKRKMELIRESMRAVTGTEGSGSDNSNSLETPQLDWYPGNQARQRPSLIYKTQSCTGMERRKGQ